MINTYFAHDGNARNSEKLLKVRFKLGVEGYGIYFMLLEKLFEENGYLEKNYEGIAFDLRTECERIRSVVEDFGLFGFKEEKFYSHSLLQRIKKINSKSDKAKKSAKARWNKPREPHANALDSQCERNASKVKKSKVNKSKEKNTNSLSGDEVFNSFWELYPKKIGKGGARKAWNKIKNPKATLEKIAKSLVWQKQSEQWKKENGQFIPHPSTYLNNERWEDEPTRRKLPNPFTQNA